jgi:hypothetical protein
MLSEEAERLVTRYREFEAQQREGAESGEQVIHVDEIATKVATFYDKLRTLVDYREAHLLRKGAIERTLRRRMLLAAPDEPFAEAFVKDLIRSGHLPNDRVPESKIAEVEAVLENLRYLLGERHEASRRARREVYRWLLRVFASALEETLYGLAREALIADLMYETLRPRIVLKRLSLEGKALDMQLYIAVRRAALRFDDNQLQYALIKLLYPHWGRMSAGELEEVIPKLDYLRRNIQTLLRHPAGPYLLKMCQKEKIAFQLAGGLIFIGAPVEEGFEAELRTLYEDRYARTASQIKKLAFFSVLSFFISKVAVALLIEIPLDHAFSYSFSVTSLAMNVLFPPLLMLAIVLFIRPPSPRNFALVAREVRNILLAGNERTYVVRGASGAGRFTSFLVKVLYLAALAIVLFYAVRYLRMLAFSPASIVIFLLFTSMIIATGVKIDNRSKEMSMEGRRSTIFGFLTDLIIIPFTAIGRWVIAGLARFNVFVITFDLFVELPLGFFVEFLENFRAYVNAKKEEIR